MRRSLRVKLTALICAAVIVVAMLVGIISISETRNVTLDDAQQIMQTMNEIQSTEVNSTIERIEQSVNTMADIANATIQDVTQFQTYNFYVKNCTDAMEMTALELAMNTNGAMSIYIRYNPEFTNPTSGLFLCKSQDEFEKLEPTDFTMYEPSDDAHVGWYYIPVQKKAPVWLDPYLNENVNIYMISYVVPLIKDNTVLGVVGMDVDFSEIAEKVSGVKLYESGYAYLLNSEYEILVHKDYETGTNLKEVLPEIYNVLQQDKKGELLEVGSDNVMYTVLQNGMTLVISVPKSELLSTTNTLTYKLLAVMATVMAGSIIYAAIFARSIANPIKKLTGVIQVIANLDFAADLDAKGLLKRKDEIGGMARVVLQMREALADMVHHIDRSCDSLGEIATTLQNTSQGIDEIAETNSALTQELAAGMTQTAEATEDIQQNLSHIEENAVEIEKLSGDGSRLSKEIEGRAFDLASSTKQASEKTRAMYDTVKKDTENALEKSKAVEQINHLTNSIAEISSQTSLLALNASIEAARAGEAGRGFAVVATEIGKLSQQTNDTVANINNIVGEVNAAVLDMAKCLDISMDFIGNTVLKDYENFGKVSEQYREDAGTFEENMSNVNGAIVELTANITSIKGAMDGIRTTVTEAGISINEIAKSSQNMTEKTGQNKQMANDSMENVNVLTDIVGKFKL